MGQDGLCRLLDLGPMPGLLQSPDEGVAGLAEAS